VEKLIFGDFFLEFCLILRTLRRKTKSKKVAYFRLGFLEKNENHQKIIQKWNFFQKKTIKNHPNRPQTLFPHISYHFGLVFGDSSHQNRFFSSFSLAKCLFASANSGAKTMKIHEK